MLIQFNFSNFKSFRNEVSLDMSATKISEHKKQVVEIANDKLLPIAAIYGANASGKSNVWEAFANMRYWVMRSSNWGGADGKSPLKRRHIVTPFMFDMKSTSEPSTFETFFVDKLDKSKKTYQYGFSTISGIIAEEWLFTKAKSAKEYKTIFYRSAEKNQLNLEGIDAKHAENIKISLQPEALVISLGRVLKIPIFQMVYEWFRSCPVVDLSLPIPRLPSAFYQEIEEQKKVASYLNTFDKSITGFEVVKISGNDAKRQGQDSPDYRIYTKHKLVGSDESAQIPLTDESMGTKSMLALYAPLEDVLRNGGVLFVDELNSKLHPLLVKNVIQTFTDSERNKNNAQLIFSSHDTWQLSNDTLRRDEIWFTEKNTDGVSMLFSLADFMDEEGKKIRNDENYQKNYLLGKYGAVPSLETINFMLESSL